VSAVRVDGSLSDWFVTTNVYCKAVFYHLCCLLSSGSSDIGKDNHQMNMKLGSTDLQQAEDFVCKEAQSQQTQL